MKNYNKILAMLAALCLCLSLMGGCAAKVQPAPAESEAPEAPAAEDEQPVEAPAPSEEAEKTYAEVEMPFTQEPATLQYFLASPNTPKGGGIDGYADFQVIKNLEAASNVHMEFVECAFTAYATQFNLVCASGDLPDLISGVSTYYAAGLTAAYDENIVISLNDYLDDCAPDFLRLVEEKGIDKAVRDDDGNVLQFCQVLDELAQKSGAVVRSDWLEELGMEVPTTVSQLGDVLAAFKSEYDCAQPLYMTSTNTGANILAAYGLPADGTADCLYQQDGQVKAVYDDPSLKDFLMLLNDWYEQDLFSHDYMAVAYDPFAQAEKVLLAEDDVGVWNANLNDLTGYDEIAGEGFALEPMPSLVQNEGDELHFSTLSYVESAAVSVTTGCESPELAVKWANYWYSEEGSNQYNYGIEGETFDLVDGEAIYTDAVINNDLGLSTSQYLRLYCLAGQLPGYQDQRRTACFYTDLQNKAWDVWSSSLGDSANVIPANLSLTGEESSEFASIVTDIYTYASENIPKFVMGENSFDDWDGFVEQIKAMNIDRCIEIYQDALDRYNAR